jgi:hypothetical protein
MEDGEHLDAGWIFGDRNVAAPYLVRERRWVSPD